MNNFSKKSLVEKLFKSLVGTWEIKRKINDRLIFRQDFLEGKADFVGFNFDGQLKYREDLILNSLHLFKEYLYYYDKVEEKIKVYFCDNYGEVKNYNDTLKLFHTINFKEENKKAKCYHLCKLDIYKAEYSFKDENNFEIFYAVNGPKKDYQIFSVYTRLI